IRRMMPKSFAEVLAYTRLNAAWSPAPERLRASTRSCREEDASLPADAPESPRPAAALPVARVGCRSILGFNTLTRAIPGICSPARNVRWTLTHVLVGGRH